MVAETWEHAYIQANGVRFHYVSQGLNTNQGALVLLLHGFPEHWYSWRHQIAPLAEAGYRVVAPDLRGYNLSSKPRRGYDIKTLTADVDALIRAFGEESAIVVGHDWGGVIALQFPLDYPEVCSKLVIMNAPTVRSWYWGPRNFPRNLYALKMHIPGLVERRRYRDIDSAAELTFRRRAVNSDAFSDADIATFARAMKQPGGLSNPMKYYRNLYWPDRWLTRGDRNKRITCPTLFAWGRDDHAVRPEFADDTGKNIDDLKIVWIDDASHWVQQDQPETVNRALLDFLGPADAAPAPRDGEATGATRS